jgi:hypothetical protein
VQDGKGPAVHGVAHLDPVLEVASDEDVSMIALGWAQDLARGQAAVVREVLGRSPVPVLLVPVRSAAPAAR